MHNLFLIIFLCNLVSCSTLVYRLEDENKKFYNVNDTAKYPFVVAIQLSNINKSHPVYCTGTIVNRQWIITAKICGLYKDTEVILDPKLLIAVVGSSNFTDVSVGNIYRIKKIHIEYDIAFMRMTRQFIFNKLVNKASFDKETYFYEDKKGCVVIGWSRPVTTQDPVLRWMPISEFIECTDCAEKHLMCGFNHKNEEYANYHDTGAPLVCPYENSIAVSGFINKANPDPRPRCGPINKFFLFTKIGFFDNIMQRIANANSLKISYMSFVIMLSNFI